MRRRGTRPAGRGVAILVALTLFMEHLDGTILVTAAPQIAADFGVNSADINITMSGYLVAVACAIPFGGWLTARRGARLVFCSSIVLFVIASVLCIMSESLTWLLLGRLLQGFAGGLMVPVGRFVVLRATDHTGIVRAIALITWPALVAPVLAPVLGGFITEIASWHWIFIINVPLGIAALVAALIMVRDSERQRRTLDWGGLLLTTLTILSVMTAVELVARGALLAAAIAGATGLAAGSASVAWLLRATHPLLDLHMFALATFRVANSSGFVFRMVVTSVPFLLPLLFQDSFGWSAVDSGLAVTALFVGNIGAKPFTTWLMRVLGFRAVIIGSVVGMVVTLALFAAFSPAWTVGLIWAISLASGAARSVGFTAYNSIQFADVPRDEIGAANSLSAMLAQLSGALGIAVGATTLRLADAIVADEATAYVVTFAVLAALLALPLLGTYRLPGDAGRNLSGTRR